MMLRRTQSIVGIGATRLCNRVHPVSTLSTRGMAMAAKQYKASDKGSGSSASSPVVRNEGIRFPTMRVVFTNPETGAADWKIMERNDALRFAKSMDLDLILVNGKADPPVCKVEDFAEKIQEIKAKDKELKVSKKARALKEMFMTGGIEKRDFLTKMKKVNEFLTTGHPVKVTVVPKRFLKNDRFKNGVRRDRMHGFDETVLMLLEFVENLPIIMTEQKVKRPPPLTHLRNGQKIIVKKDDKKAAKAAVTARPTGDGDEGESSDTEDTEAEKGEVIDGEDLGDDSEDEEEEEAQTGPNGQRLVLRREFMLTPKGEMIEKPKKSKERREQRDKEKSKDKDTN